MSELIGGTTVEQESFITTMCCLLFNATATQLITCQVVFRGWGYFFPHFFSDKINEYFALNVGQHASIVVAVAVSQKNDNGLDNLLKNKDVYSRFTIFPKSVSIFLFYYYIYGPSDNISKT